MHRVLDLDLDFFVHGAAHLRSSRDGRLEEEYYEAWTPDEGSTFLRERCGLQGRRPGLVVEHHGEMFGAWRDLIDAGLLVPPFHVTHVDAHVDLGLGDAGYIGLMTDVVFWPVEERVHPPAGPYGLGDGNFLSFAIACRWLHDLTFVFNDARESDLLLLHMENFDPEASNIQLLGTTRDEIDRNMFQLEQLTPTHKEPAVPYREVLWSDFVAQERYDFVCLCRSPGFTPASADAVFDRIVDEFIDVSARG